MTKNNIQHPIKIKVSGQGGNGVKYMTSTLAKYLDKKGFNVSLVYNYDSAVRGGNIEANLIYSQEKINSPIFNQSDMEFDFSTGKLIISDTGKEEEIDCQDKLQQLQKKSESLAQNMLVLGLLIANMEEVDLDLGKMEDTLKKKFKEKNIQAIKKAYQAIK